MLLITILTISLPGLLKQLAGGSELSAEQIAKLQEKIRSTSIKVLAHGQTIGSGILFGRLDNVYTVATNAHVIQSARSPFQLQTPDGEIYAAALVAPPLGQNRDLSILRFQSRRIYHIAKSATSMPKVGDRVWASGFPLDPQTLSAQSQIAPTGLTIVDGQITHIFRIAISGGYSIGYDSPIRKGMSGGALVNRDGELVGMNGVHADPLWNTAEVLEDGSTVSEIVQEQISRSSWAIPTQLIKDYLGAIDESD